MKHKFAAGDRVAVYICTDRILGTVIAPGSYTSQIRGDDGLVMFYSNKQCRRIKKRKAVTFECEWQIQQYLGSKSIVVPDMFFNKFLPFVGKKTRVSIREIK